VKVPVRLRDQTITIRVSALEKAALASLAKVHGLSLSEFLLRSGKSAGMNLIESVRHRAALNEIFTRPKPRRRPIPTSPPKFRVPYLQARHAAPFEEVVSFVADRMNSSEHTIAVAMTYIGEAISNAVAEGYVFRWPGFFAVGPYLVEGRDGLHCRPRFQANPPFVNHVSMNCSGALARNREMQAHRRRRRHDRSGTTPDVMFRMRHAIARGDVRVLDYFESAWRDDSPIHRS
jgi:hypothetical protein